MLEEISQNFAGIVVVRRGSRRYHSGRTNLTARLRSPLIPEPPAAAKLLTETLPAIWWSMARPSPALALPSGAKSPTPRPADGCTIPVS